MFIIGKKETNYEKLMKEFSKLKDGRSKKEYEDIENIHSEIEKYYRNKMMDEKFNAKIERIRLEKKLTGHEGFSLGLNIAASVALAAVILTFIIALFIEGIKEYNWATNVAASSVMILLFVRYFIKDIAKKRPRYVVISISLKILEELEKEKEEEQAEVKRIETWSRLEKLLKKEDFVEDVILPKALEAGAELVDKMKKQSLFKKLFKKKEKYHEVQ